jgi:hypothetical protein
LLTDEGPADRASPDRLTGYIAEARELIATASLSEGLKNIRRMLEVMAPEREWDWITRHPGAPTTRELRANKKERWSLTPACYVARRWT